MPETYAEIIDCRNGWSMWAVCVLRSRWNGEIVASYSLPSRETVYCGPRDDDGNDTIIPGDVVMVEAMLTAKP